MDPICHTLTGAALGGTGLRKLTPYGTAALVLAANAPDADVFIYAVADEYAGLAFRRGITHGLPALLLWPFVVVGVLLAWHRRPWRPERGAPARPGPLLGLSLLGVTTHPTLDWLNTYGMRWLLPFDGSWSYGDAVFIVDPWMWLGLGGGAFLAWRWGWTGFLGWSLFAAAAGALLVTYGGIPDAARLLWLLGAAAVVAAYLPARREESRRVLAARLLTAAVGVYAVLMVLSSLLAEREARRTAELAGVEEIRELMAGPVPANPLERRVVIRTAGGYRFGTFRWRGEPRLTLRPDSLPARSDELPAAVMDAALSTDDARDYLVWSRFPYVAGRPEGDGWRVRLGDARYGNEAGGLGGLTIRLGPDLRPR